MQVKVTRAFKYQVDARTVVTVEKGTYKVPGEVAKDVAEKIVRYRHGQMIESKKPVKKKAPENKVRGKSPGSKKKVASTSMRRRGTGAGSKR